MLFLDPHLILRTCTVLLQLALLPWDSRRCRIECDTLTSSRERTGTPHTSIATGSWCLSYLTRLVDLHANAGVARVVRRASGVEAVRCNLVLVGRRVLIFPMKRSIDYGRKR